MSRLIKSLLLGSENGENSRLHQQASSSTLPLLPQFFNCDSVPDDHREHNHRPYSARKQSNHNHTDGQTVTDHLTPCAATIQQQQPRSASLSSTSSTSSLASSSAATTSLEHYSNRRPNKTRKAMSKLSGITSSNISSSTSTRSTYDVISNPNSDEEDYDCDQLGDNDSNNENAGGAGISWVMATFLLINAALGAGLLNYPVAYDRLGGIGFATVIQIFVVIMMASTMTVLVYCARVYNESSYHGVLRTMCGTVVMRIAAASIAITCFGICVTFVIIVGDQFDRLFATHIGPQFCRRWYANRNFSMSLTSALLIWPLCYFRRLDFLRHVNLLGVMASFYVIFLNVYVYFTTKAREPFAPPIRTKPESAMEFIAALPVVFFAYQTHEIVIPVHVSMRDRSVGAFGRATVLSLLMLLVLYCCGGTFGYLTFGSKVAPDIMLMYDANDPFVVIGIVALIVKMITTFPPVLFCGRDTIVRLLFTRRQRSRRSGPRSSSHSNRQNESSANKVSTNDRYQSIDRDHCDTETHNREQVRYSPPRSPILEVLTNQSYQFYHACITTIWNIITLALAIVIPNITIAIGFLGSLAACNVFVFPGLTLIALARRYRREHRAIDHVGRESNQANDRNHNGSAHPIEAIDEHSSLLAAGNRAFYTRMLTRLRRIDLSHTWLQMLLIAYGAFIIAMGIIMFVIILMQVYEDMQKPIAHGAVCDAELTSNPQSTNQNPNSTSTSTSLSSFFPPT